ncbi:MAG TPA: hypothetical protein VMW70_14945 [Burkholderiales bacterium]|nr:hypothetical protein [Burkholderiales bacterium]
MSRSMRGVSYMKIVIELRRLGERIHEQITSGRSSPEYINPLVAQVHQMNAGITPLSDQFSRTLGEANCALRSQLLMVIIAAAIILIPASVFLSRRMPRRSEVFESAS